MNTKTAADFTKSHTVPPPNSGFEKPPTALQSNAVLLLLRKNTLGSHEKHLYVGEQFDAYYFF